MSFFNNLIGEFTHQGQGENYGSGQQYPPQSAYSNQGPPQVPSPWIAEWDAPANRWIFINRQTDERTFNYPQQYQQYGQQSYGGGGYERQDGYAQEAPKPNHSGRNMALAGVGGLATGALLMHEGEKVEEHWDEDKYRVEQEFDKVEDAPENAARWAGRKVQDVEDIPGEVEGWKDWEEYRAEQRFDDGVQDVEDAPEDMARWAGRKVQDVEDIPGDTEGRVDYDVDRVERRFDDSVQDVDRFDDHVDDAFNEGRDEGRDDDRW